MGRSRDGAVILLGVIAGFLGGIVATKVARTDPVVAQEIVSDGPVPTGQ